MELSFNLVQSTGLAVLVLLFGKVLCAKIGFLSKFCIPAPVVGGLIFAIANLFLHNAGIDIIIDNTLQAYFMVLFFTTVGFGASFAVLKKGGIGIIIFLILASVLCVIQNLVGVGISVAMGQDPLLGIATGAVPMTGGHGTAAAFGPLLEDAGLEGGNVIAVAAATFGLISGSLIGGPTAYRIINKRGLKSNQAAAANLDMSLVEDKAVELDGGNLCTAFFQISVATFFGSYVSAAFDAVPQVTLPAYVGGMLVAIVLRNIFTDNSFWPTRHKEITALGEIFLGVFLALALMTMNLWQLAGMAGPMAVILLVQVVVMFLYATFVTFKVMGSDYDAAVLAAGHCGFGMGATPNGVANMSAVVSRFGPSTKAFFILPIVGGMFIDITNMIINTTFISFLGV